MRQPLRKRIKEWWCGKAGHRVDKMSRHRWQLCLRCRRVVDRVWEES